MGIVGIGAIFVDIKGYPEDAYIPAGRNVGRVEQIHGGVGRNVAEDVANCELRPTFVSLVDRSGTGEDVLRKLKSHKVNVDYIRKTSNGIGTCIQKLTNLGILKGSEYVIDPEKIGYETCAYIGIYLKDPESFDSVTKALEAIPEVVECHFTTGKYDMFIKIYAKNNHHLLSIIHDKLQPLGLARTETLISFHEAIKRQMPIMVDVEDED